MHMAMFFSYVLFFCPWASSLVQNTKVVCDAFVCRRLRSPGRVCSLFFAMG